MRRIAPESRGAVLGVQQSWSSAARVLGPLVAGLTFDRIGPQFPLFAAAAVLCGLPITVVFLAAQRWIVSGLTAGGVKG